MATLWEIVTGNSSLAVDSVNTLWDHLNNQAGGVGGDVFVGSGLTARIDLEMTADLGVALSANISGVELTANMGENLSSNIEQDLI